MRSLCVVVSFAWLVAPVAAGFHPDAHRAHEEHWRGHPEQPERLAQLWHERFFHGVPPGAWLAHWVDELKRGIAPEVAVAEIVASPEYWARCGGRLEVFVRTMFLDVVGRPPTPAEYDFWLRRFYHEDRAQVAQALLARYPPAWIAGEPASPAAVPVPIPVPVPTYEYRAPIVHYHR